LPDGTNSLVAGISEVYYGLLSPINNSVPPYLYQTYSSDVTNGLFTVAQRGTSFVSPATGVYDLDGWLLAYISSALVTITQVAESTFDKFTRVVTVTTADNAVVAADFFCQETRIEGYDCIKYLKNGFTIGFYVKSSVIGIHCISVFNGTSSYVMEYTINVANTWEYKTVNCQSGTPFLASFSTGPGFVINFCNMAGSNYRTTPNAWQTGNFKASANQVNDVANTGNVFALTMVTMNQGGTALLDTLNIEQELSRCQRYFTANTYYVSATPANVGYPVTMPKSPTITGGGAGFTYTAGRSNAVVSQTTPGNMLLLIDATL